jgi:hypothetical protein
LRFWRSKILRRRFLWRGSLLPMGREAPSLIPPAKSDTQLLRLLRSRTGAISLATKARTSHSSQTAAELARRT